MTEIQRLDALAGGMTYWVVIAAVLIIGIWSLLRFFRSLRGPGWIEQVNRACRENVDADSRAIEARAQRLEVMRSKHKSRT